MTNEQIEPFKNLLLVISLSGVRMTTAFNVAPFFGDQFIQGAARNAVILSLTLVLVPLVLPTLPAQPLGVLELLALLAKEVVLGVCIGFLAGIAFWAAEGVGLFIDNQTGSTMSSVLDPLSGENASPLGSLMIRTITVIFFSTGGFLVFLGALFESYRLFPIYSFYPRFDADFPLVFLGLLDKLVRLIVLCAAPVAIALFLVEFGLGLMNRFAPSLNVFSLSMPMKSGTATFLLILYLGVLMTFLRREMVNADRLTAFLHGVFHQP